MSMIKTVSENGVHPQAGISDTTALRLTIEEVVGTEPVVDVHTHLFAPEFGAMNLFGIDELLTYHYLVAETFRSADVSPAYFWSLGKAERADIVWKALFVENSPISEAALGVVTVLGELGIDPNTRNLNEIRAFYRERDAASHIDFILKKANVSRVVMTNDPFDSHETEVWNSGVVADPRFAAALRLDRVLNDWPNTSAKLGLPAEPRGRDLVALRNFLDQWVEKMNPLYMAVSLPDDFYYFSINVRNTLIREVVLPMARDYSLPFSPMIGVRRGVNPALRLAGDGVGRADVRSLEKMCLENPDVNFLATFLSRENQHELCVAARKFANLMPFGCWWFLNNPSIVREITRERFELLGPSFIPQHSDARVLDQLLYKWKHSRTVIAGAMYESYARLLAAGRSITRGEIERDVTRLFSGNFNRTIGVAPRQNG